VPTNTFSDVSPIRTDSLSFISFAALFVKVTAIML